MPTSNWGAVYQSQGILAPGENVVGAAHGGGIAAGSGTSFATPIVSGVAALFLSLQLKRGQRPDAVAVRQALLRTHRAAILTARPDFPVSWQGA